jgi:Lon protease-like protein
VSAVTKFLRHLADRLDGQERYSSAICLTPKTAATGTLGRVTVEFNDPDDGLKALASAGSSRFREGIADEIGAVNPFRVRRDPFGDDDEDGDE